eukprot:TRINITY_DN14850_c0_g3_i1.p1 TRINITY_DN14850_c0_g3~~TRINITY_DN14850_c0_g3_i1.p1  ORF type:complete len:146 (-),score=15.87 TRINITY_DN14850_c0_g3_i1:714-1151(-)
MSKEVMFRTVLRQSCSRQSYANQTCARSQLVNVLSNMLICREHKDICIWKPETDGKITAKFFYGALEQSSGSQTPIVQVLLGLKPLVVDNLRRVVFDSENISNICSSCRKERETTNHLYLHSDIFSFLLGHFIKKCSSPCCILVL